MIIQVEDNRSLSKIRLTYCSARMAFTQTLHRRNNLQKRNCVEELWLNFAIILIFYQLVRNFVINNKLSIFEHNQHNHNFNIINIMKKFFSLLIVVFAASMIFVSCGGNGATGSNDGRFDYLIE